jgi:hypothetical protein
VHARAAPTRGAGGPAARCDGASAGRIIFTPARDAGRETVERRLGLGVADARPLIPRLTSAAAQMRPFGVVHNVVVQASGRPLPQKGDSKTQRPSRHPASISVTSIEEQSSQIVSASHSSVRSSDSWATFTEMKEAFSWQGQQRLLRI